MAQRIQHRRDTSSNWAAANPILAAGEIGVEFDDATDAVVAVRLGDGATAWNELDRYTTMTDVQGAVDNATSDLAPKTALRLPGVNGNQVSTPDHASLSITGDVDLRAEVAPDLSTSYQVILSKGNRSYELGVNSAGTIRLVAQRADSTELNVISPQVAFSAAGQMRWVRATFNAGTGQVQFFASDDDGATWVSLGNVAGSATTLLTNADPVYMGQRQVSFPLSGKVVRAQVYDGIDGALVADYRADAPMGPRYQDSTGKVWTINGSAWTWMVA